MLLKTENQKFQKLLKFIWNKLKSKKSQILSIFSTFHSFLCHISCLVFQVFLTWRTPEQQNTIQISASPVRRFQATVVFRNLIR